MRKGGYLRIILKFVAGAGQKKVHSLSQDPFQYEKMEEQIWGGTVSSDIKVHGKFKVVSVGASTITLF